MPIADNDALYESSWKFVQWLDEQVTAEARGDTVDEMTSEPKATFWLGRLAPEASVANNPLGKRAEKLDPCAIGIRLRPATDGPWTFQVTASFFCWRKVDGAYIKSDQFQSSQQIVVHPESLELVHTLPALDDLLHVAGLINHRVELRTDLETWRENVELVVSLVNASDEPTRLVPDTHIYQAQLTVVGLDTAPFELESLPDSFRYDRTVPAIGINCGVISEGTGHATSDTIAVDKYRPTYWNAPTSEPDFTFATMSTDPLPQLEKLIADLSAWGGANWGPESLVARGAGWTPAMKSEAEAAAGEFDQEVARIQRGYQLLATDPHLLTAFKLASASVGFASRGKYPGWRAFQVGFLVAALEGIASAEDAEYVDTVWFATGGGKTETYLGLLVTAILYDRLGGKRHGISAWSRFPLRMLSLQQTQRFADVLAGAEIQRRSHEIPGAPLALGFFVGASGTPNKIDIDPKAGAPDSLDASMPAKFQVLLYCPFCHQSDTLTMAFDRASWTLRHVCLNEECPWPNPALPFFVVDQEIFRFLPSVVVGTLDKAAMVGMQAAMRGFFGPPLGVCDKDGHGYCYSPRSASPNGCLVPGCRGSKKPLPMPGHLWAPRLRLQDELHLLRDSLGAVGSHYESILDHLQFELTGTRAKIVASSATLSGFERQVDVLYRRTARVFPQPGPSLDESFWTQSGKDHSRRYVAVAPRGVTMEFVSDRTLGVLQSCVRRLVDDPTSVCDGIGIPVAHADHLVSMYGVNVVYGNTRKDVEAARRSADTQFPFEVNAEALTGGTPFDTVRRTLERLDKPESAFTDRIHLVAASSMISHGVDVDRLNTMVMLGLPLTTAEFIQTSARVGRRWPGIVYVLHRITREREVATYAQFDKFVTQGDRFVEPIPITRSSRRVLALTTSGAEEARRLAIHEPESGGALTTVRKVRDYYGRSGISADSEERALCAALGLDGPLDELLQQDLRDWAASYFNALNDPATHAPWPSDLSPSGKPMISLRDVETGVPIFGEE